MTGTPPVALTVAGTDSGGAAGVAADLATFAALGVHGACAVTAVTAQDTTGVHAVHQVPVAMLEQQLDAVFDDLPVAVLKTGMLGSAEAVRCVAERAVGVCTVVDPVLVATSGAVLGGEEVRRALVDVLLPVSRVVTPNRGEARALLGYDDSPDRLAAALAALGPVALVTGGPDTDTASTCTDWLALPGQRPVPLTHPRVHTANDHGTGCTFSAALAALLAHRPALDWPALASRAARFTTDGLADSRSWQLGRGRGPVAHLSTPGTPHHPHHEEIHDVRP